MGTKGIIDGWRRMADEEFDAAEDLIEKTLPRHALLFAYMAIEDIVHALTDPGTRWDCGFTDRKQPVLDFARARLSREQVQALEELMTHDLLGWDPERDDVYHPTETAHLLSEAKRIYETLRDRL